MISNISNVVAQMPDDELSMWRLAYNSTCIFDGERGAEWNVYVRSSKVTSADMVDGQDPSQIARMQIVAITEDKSVCVEYKNEFNEDDYETASAEWEDLLDEDELDDDQCAETYSKYCRSLFEAELNDFTASLYMCDILNNGAEGFEIQPAFELPTALVCSDPAWAREITFSDIPKTECTYEPFSEESDPVPDSKWMDSNLLYYNGYRANPEGGKPAGLEFSRSIIPAVNSDWHVNDWFAGPEGQMRNEMAKGLYDATYIYGPKFSASRELYLDAGYDDNPMFECPADVRISLYQALRKAQSLATAATIACPSASVNVYASEDESYVVTVYVAPDKVNRAMLVELDSALAG